MWTQGIVSREAVCLNTARMRIRPCSEIDPVAYAKAIERNRQHVAAYMPDEILGLDAKGVEGFLGSLAQAWDQGNVLCFVATSPDTSVFLAQIYVQLMDREAGIAEIGYFSDADNQGFGFVAEAVREVSQFLFDQVGVHKICVVCDQGHMASARVAERCGYTLEAVLRRHALNKDGSRPDRCFYSRFADDA